MRLIDLDAIEWHDYLVASGNGMYYDDKVAYKSQVDDLPIIKPERKKGRWTKAYDGNDQHVKCAYCFKTYDWISQAQYYSFCPNCGADMRETKNV